MIFLVFLFFYFSKNRYESVNWIIFSSRSCVLRKLRAMASWFVSSNEEPMTDMDRASRLSIYTMYILDGKGHEKRILHGCGWNTELLNPWDSYARVHTSHPLSLGLDLPVFHPHPCKIILKYEQKLCNACISQIVSQLIMRVSECA